MNTRNAGFQHLPGYQPREGSALAGGRAGLRAAAAAILESTGLKPVRQQLGPQSWWSGSVLDDCRVYVPVDEAESARQALVETEPEP